MKLLGPIKFDDTTIQSTAPVKGAVEVSATAPVGIIEGQIWYDVNEISGPQGTTIEPYDISGGTIGKPSSEAIVGKLLAARNFILPVFLSGSLARVSVAATITPVDFKIKKNNVDIGLIKFSINQLNATFEFNQQVSFVFGDALTIVAPLTMNETLSDLSFTLVGVLN